MIRTVTVVKTGDSLQVKNDDISSAKAVTARRFWGVRERSYSVINPRDLTVDEGDTVEIFLPPGRTVLSSAITFLLPLMLFPVGFSLAGRFVPGAGEGVSFLVGFGALLAGLPLGALIRKGRNTVPEITKVLTPAEAISCKLKAEGCGSCKACG
jgi:positive regulator of sigma E activity